MKTVKTSEEICSRGDFADQGTSGKILSNDFVTIDALTVLKSAGRL